MWQSKLDIDKYQYARTNPHVVRLLGLLGIGATLFMGYGFWKYLQIHSLYLYFFGPLIALFVINKLLRFSLQLFYQKFDIAKHEAFVREYWATHEEPAVDIFLPYAGEELSVHEEVLKAVQKLRYKKYTVYMLDDVGSAAHHALADAYGFVYLSRPNKGEHKKSGNLEFGYRHSNGAFVLILDADFIPARDALYDLVPYIASDPDMGILQTPQYFEQTKTVHSRSLIEFGGGNIVEDFYRIVMPCRDEFKAAMCVGTSALYRRTAIDKLQGTPKVHASEDLATGLLITQFGYYVKYLPLIVSMGKSPESVEGYFKQHLRWCSGNLVFAKYWPKAHLSLPARLVYIVNPMHYLSEASTVFFSFQFLILLYFHSESLSIVNTVYFIPYLIVNRLLIPLFKANKSRLGTKIAALSNSYTYFYTYLRMMVKGVPSWQPTGVKTRGLHKDFVRSYHVGMAISSLYILLFVIILLLKPRIMGNYNTYVVLTWSIYSAFWHILFITFVARFVRPFQLAGVESYAKKLWVHTKTNLPLILFAMLLGTATATAGIELTDARSPTVMAVHTLMSQHDQQEPPKSIALAIAPSPQPQVLGAAEHVPAGNVYTIMVGEDYSPIDLARNAVRRYAKEQGVRLSNRDVDSVAYSLYKDHLRTEMPPGNMITIPVHAIELSILESDSDQQTAAHF